MFIEAKKLIGLPIAAFDTQSKIGQVQQLLVDPGNGNILGFIVTTGGLLTAKKALSAVDIRDWDPNGIVTGSFENLVNTKEIVRIQEIINRKIYLIGMPAKTESGKGLGKVEDLLIDTDTLSVNKYYLRDLLGHSRIYPSDKVVKIDHQIIFADDVSEIPSGAAGVPA